MDVRSNRAPFPLTLVACVAVTVGCVIAAKQQASYVDQLLQMSQNAAAAPPTPTVPGEIVTDGHAHYLRIRTIGGCRDYLLVPGSPAEHRQHIRSRPNQPPTAPRPGEEMPPPSVADLTSA